MASNFPALGPEGQDGLRGMFIGEDHNDALHVRALLENWPAISEQIDVLFLEYYDGRVVPTLSPRKTITSHLLALSGAESLRYAANPLIDHHLRTLGVLARASGTVVRGFDVQPHPPAYAFAAVRLSFEVNMKMAMHIRTQMTQLGKKRFLAFGGCHHGPLIRHFMPLVCYFARDEASYCEYQTVQWDGRPVLVEDTDEGPASKRQRLI